MSVAVGFPPNSFCPRIFPGSVIMSEAMPSHLNVTETVAASGSLFDQCGMLRVNRSQAISTSVTSRWYSVKRFTSLSLGPVSLLAGDVEIFGKFRDDRDCLTPAQMRPRICRAWQPARRGGFDPLAQRLPARRLFPAGPGLDLVVRRPSSASASPASARKNTSTRWLAMRESAASRCLRLIFWRGAGYAVR